MRLAPFHYRVEFVPGKELLVADALSRAPVEKGNDSKSEEMEMHLSMVTVAGIPASDELFRELAEETKKDPELSRLMPYLLSEWPRTRQRVHQDVRAYWDSRHLLSTVNGLVFRGERIFIQTSLRKEMIGKAHEGHLGIAKTKARAREHMWWPGMARALEEAVIRCQTCAQFRHQQQKEPLMTTQLPERPWQQVGSDLFEWEGKHYLLVVDYYSRFPELRLLKHQGAKAVIAECQEIFSIHGIPEMFISDNGPQYGNTEFKQFAKKCGFEHATSSPRYPQGNGLAERTVQTVKGLMNKAKCSGEDIQLALLAYRMSPHESTGVSPAQLLMGRKIRTRLPVLPSKLVPEVMSPGEIARKDQVSRHNQASYYNRRNGVRSLETLQAGDNVAIWDIESRTWSIPGKLVRQLGARSYLVQLASGRKLRRNRLQIQRRPEGITAREQENSGIVDIGESTEEAGRENQRDENQRDEIERN
jgi:transposase InsO family protein